MVGTRESMQQFRQSDTTSEVVMKCQSWVEHVVKNLVGNGFSENVLVVPNAHRHRNFAFNL